MKTFSARTVSAAALLMVLAAACTASDSTITVSTWEPVLTVTTTTTVVPTTTMPPVTSPPTTAAGPLTQQEAYQFIFGFDPVTGDAAALAAALEVTGPRPSLNLPHFIEVGSDSVRRAVFASLASGDPWTIPMLVAMQEYGMPSGTAAVPMLWPTESAYEISIALWESANKAYGRDYADMMTDLNRLFVERELELCARNDCDWGTAWYLPPSTVTNPLGMIENGLFTGTVTVVSDTGAGDEASIMMQDLHGWVPIEGFLAELPAFGLDTESSGLFDGMVVTEPEVKLFGWATPGTKLRVGSESTTTSENWWELTVDVPETGLIEIVGESPDGTVRTERLLVNFMPQLDEAFGYITGVKGLDTGDWALEVDYAQWFSGEEATLAAREDGVIGPDDFIENDYYIRNQNPLLRTIELDQLATVRLIDATFGPLQSKSLSIAEFVQILESGDDGRWYGAASEGTPFWFMVDGERMIYQIVQQYLP